MRASAAKSSGSKGSGIGGDIAGSIAGGAANAALTQGIQAIEGLFSREFSGYVPLNWSSSPPH
ncbi:hypothetical protein PLICRDRAFT_40194 [Plicaturopsis crispa FD-325 SS-3]|nr:hypothetical protein PLICRDRAFT_40194 [Plicaturopsis crispa FD-325 SS-3]